MHKVKSNGTIKQLLEFGDAPVLMDNLQKIDIGFNKNDDEMYFRFHSKSGVQRKLTFSFKNGIYLYDSVTETTKSVRWTI